MAAASTRQQRTQRRARCCCRRRRRVCVRSGLAQVALAQGDTCQALHHYGELVSKALMGRGSAEHWAYAEYGWLLFQVRGGGGNPRAEALG